MSKIESRRKKKKTRGRRCYAERMSRAEAVAEDVEDAVSYGLGERRKRRGEECE
jgi:hypothetical protein